MTQYKTLRLILGDQLNESHHWFDQTDANVLYLIAELPQETDYVRHHIQKVCGFFLAMETFAQRLTQLGHKVMYLTLDDTASHKDLNALIQSIAKTEKAQRFEYQQPDEYRLHHQLEHLELGGVEIAKVDTEHFYLPHDSLPRYFKANTSHKMEMFYRKMRREQNILMDGDKPIGGKWNFDQENRNKLKPADIELVPDPLLFSHNVKPVLERLERHNVQTIGNIEATLIWPISREESLTLLDYFCANLLPAFGTFQDAMTAQSTQRWSLYHSRLSFSLNTKLISPREVVNAALAAHQSNKAISLAQIEGFVRQIIGWREFVRGIYWLNMPAYGKQNALKANRPLPNYFWSGQTHMNCLNQCISQSLDYAYAHHIQRLMVTGTFCLLTGIDPNEVDEWYLGIYVDALEWVELPNTRGMSQFADNGIVATKPYAASGNYINKMSDYCSGCRYQVKQKTGATACPFNSLYWHFMNQHRKQLEANPRIGMIYRNWDKMDRGSRELVLERANWCLEHIEEL